MGKSICKGVGKNLSCKYSQNMDHAKQYATDAFKAASKRVIQQTLEATDDLIGNKIADKITITVLWKFPSRMSQIIWKDKKKK